MNAGVNQRPISTNFCLNYVMSKILSSFNCVKIYFI